VNRECYEHAPLSLTLIEKKAVRLNESVKEETVILAKETGFQEASEDVIVKLLKSHSLIYMSEEQAGLERRTYKGAHDFHGDVENVTSEENTLTI
jgi:hypothetical protein